MLVWHACNRKSQVCSAVTSKRLLNAFLLSIMRLSVAFDRHTQTNKCKKREKEKKREKKRKKREREKISYVLAKLSLSYPVRRRKECNRQCEHTKLALQTYKERKRKRRKKKNDESKRMPSQDKWDCIKQLSAVAQVNCVIFQRKREREDEKKEKNIIILPLKKTRK